MTQEEYEKYDTYLFTIKDIEVRDKEIERLNNIINELENHCIEMIIEYNKELKEIDNSMDKMNLLGAKISYDNIFAMIQELKDSDKE